MFYRSLNPISTVLPQKLLLQPKLYYPTVTKLQLPSKVCLVYVNYFCNQSYTILLLPDHFRMALLRYRSISGSMLIYNAFVVSYSARPPIYYSYFCDILSKAVTVFRYIRTYWYTSSPLLLLYFEIFFLEISSTEDCPAWRFRLHSHKYTEENIHIEAS